MTIRKFLFAFHRCIEIKSSKTLATLSTDWKSTNVWSSERPFTGTLQKHENHDEIFQNIRRLRFAIDRDDIETVQKHRFDCPHCRSFISNSVESSNPHEARSIRSLEFILRIGCRFTKAIRVDRPKNISGETRAAIVRRKKVVEWNGTLSSLLRGEQRTLLVAVSFPRVTLRVFQTQDRRTWRSILPFNGWSTFGKRAKEKKERQPSLLLLLVHRSFPFDPCSSIHLCSISSPKGDEKWIWWS